MVLLGLAIALLSSRTAVAAGAAEPALGDEPAAAEVASNDLKKLSLEELMNTEVVTSLSKRAEPRSEAPAAVDVITAEDIRRSGVTSIPEALRLAPGIQVARINSNQWAIGIRGFGSRLSRSMLALMDGRSLYDPLFAGVYWEVQDTLLEDLDRIEVIRGPGGTLWGANAVNGVINIITKSAKDTQGTLVSGGGGSEERGFGSVRYGGKLGDSTHFRVYGKYFDRSGEFNPGAPAFDGWNMARAGFRSDSELATGDHLTVQGDLYDGNSGQRVATFDPVPPFEMRLHRQDADFSGGNVLGRWTHQTGEDSEVTLQAYYDQTFRRDVGFEEQRNTGDVDLQHRFHLPGHQQIVWGLGYRVSSDQTRGSPEIQITPAGRDFQLYSGFVQDEIAIVPDRLSLIVGTKIEHNDFSGFEFQPSGRLLWTPALRHVGWASITRAVRTPSRIERDLGIEAVIDPQTQTAIRLSGDGEFASEKVLAYEVGYRYEPIPQLFLDIATFYNRYTDLLSVEQGGPQPSASPSARFIIPFLLRNHIDADVYGVELGADAAIFDWWRIGAAYSYLHMALQKEGGSQDVSTIESTEGSSPHHQLSLRSMMDLQRDLELDAWFRYVDALPAQKVASYVTLDLRLGWRATANLELSVVGQNLLENHHAEFGSDQRLPNVEIERGGYGKLTWRW